MSGGGDKRVPVHNWRPIRNRLGCKRRVLSKE
jgi:hypothetical protein